MALDEQHLVSSGEGASIRRVQKSEGHYRRLFEKMLNGFVLHEIVYDENGQPYDYRVVEVNPAFEQLTGLNAGAGMGGIV